MTFGKWANVARLQSLCWHMKIAFVLLAASAQTDNNIRNEGVLLNDSFTMNADRCIKFDKNDICVP